MISENDRCRALLATDPESRAPARQVASLLLAYMAHVDVLEKENAELRAEIETL